MILKPLKIETESEKRRALLKLGLFGLASLLFDKNSQGKSEFVRGSYLLVGSDDSMYVIDLRNNGLTCIPLNFGPHSFLLNPIDQNKVWAISKAQNCIAEVDIRTMRIINKIYSPPSMNFYGHGAFSHYGHTFYVSLINKEKGDGWIVEYNTKLLEVEQLFRVSVGGVHQCRLLSKDHLIITSTGVAAKGKRIGSNFITGPRLEKTSLVQMNLKTKKIERKITIENDSQLIGHFEIINDSSIIALTTPWVDYMINNPKHGGEVYHLTKSSFFEKIEIPAVVENQFRGEMLSAATIASLNEIVITNPGGNLILFVDLAKGRLKSSLNFQANGVVVDTAASRLVFTPVNSHEITYLNFAENQRKLLKPDLVSNCKHAHFFNSGHALLV